MTDYETRRLALGDALRQLRDAADLSGKEFGRLAGWGASKVSRVETAKQSVSDADVRAYCRIANASEEVEAELRQELREIRIEAANWKRQLRTGHRAVQEYSHQLEHAASRIRSFEIAVIPGLVQTAQYARYAFESSTRLHQVPRDIDEAVAARLARQDVVHDSSKTIEILCAEAALRHPIAPPAVMTAQLDRLLALSDMSTMQFAILPLDAPVSIAPLHGFVIVDDLCLVETFNTEMSITDADELAKFHRLFDTLWDAAAKGAEARAILQRLISLHADPEVQSGERGEQ